MIFFEFQTVINFKKWYGPDLIFESSGRDHSCQVYLENSQAKCFNCQAKINYFDRSKHRDGIWERTRYSRLDLNLFGRDFAWSQ